MARSRSINFIVNNFEEDDVKKCENIEKKFQTTFIMICKLSERLNVFIHFKNPMRFSSILKIIKRAKQAIVYNDPIKNFNWCKKGCDDINIWYKSEVPEQGKQITGKFVESDIKNGVSIEVIREKYPMWYMMHKKKLVDHYEEKKSIVKKNRKKMLCLIPTELKIFIAKQCTSVFFHMIEGSIETYNGEDVAIMGNYNVTADKIECWQNGFPERFRRGFEIIYFNSDIIYICYESQKEYNNLLGAFGDLINKQYSIPYTPIIENTINVNFVIENNLIIQKEKQLKNLTTNEEIFLGQNDSKEEDFKKIKELNSLVPKFDLNFNWNHIDKMPVKLNKSEYIIDIDIDYEYDIDFVVKLAKNKNSKAINLNKIEFLDDD